jgi:hypothetical protein
MAWRQRRSCGKSGACSWPALGDLWGVLCLSRQSAKGNSSGLLVSLSYHICGRFLLCSLRELGFGLPISHRTMRCWSTQRGLVCQQAHEPWEKNLVFILCMIGFLPVIGHHILWLVHPLRGSIKITYLSFTFQQTSCNKLFSIISFESLYCLC